MDEAGAEIVIVSGPLAGNRYPIAGPEFIIGCSPAASLQITDPGIGQKHCAIQRYEDGWRLIELNPGRGAFVNGLRAPSHELRDGDQIEIGNTDLLFRSGSSTSLDANSRPALLRACSLLFLFRALASASVDSATAAIESQIVRLIGDILPITNGDVLLAWGEPALCKAAADRRRQWTEPAGREFIRSLAREGAVTGSDGRSAAVPIYARQQLAGMIRIAVAAAHVEEAKEILSSIAVLAGTAIENVREIETLRNRNALLAEQIDSADTGLIGDSAAMRHLRAAIARIAPRDTTVLILGESGTGKELVARALYRQSPRACGPFVAVNCAALMDTLLESELFGHEKGAFTGAVAQKKGKLELAEGGTVFLDEIGELAPGLQAKLLRVLQEHEFDRVGGTKTVRLDVRLIAAANRDLAAEARRGAFREDLFHRLNVIALRTTPLRERPEDILPLARHFVSRAASRHRREITGFTPEAELVLSRYSWPGNVRELENAIERAVVLGTADNVSPDDLPDALQGGGEVAALSPGRLENSLGSAKRESILRAWRDAAGDYKTAAAILDIHPNSLLRTIRKLGLRDMLRQM